MRFTFILFLILCSTAFVAPSFGVQIAIEVEPKGDWVEPGTHVDLASNVEIKPQVDDQPMIEVTVAAGAVSYTHLMLATKA